MNHSDQDIIMSLDYNAHTGILRWKRRPRHHFAAERFYVRWERHFAGKVAGTASSTGYLQIHFQGKTYRAHRLAWRIAYGEWPKQRIDHINGVKDDNRLGNLRDVSTAANNRNRPVRRDSKSGVVGVTRERDCDRWRAYIRADGRQFHLGLHKTIESAILARKSAEKRFGFHPNHGRPPAGIEG